MDNHSNEDIDHVLDTTITREQFERVASGATASLTLQKLNVSVRGLPGACQALLARLGALTADPRALDAAALALRRARRAAALLDDEYQVLTLQHKLKQVQLRINRNAKLISELRSSLAEEAGAGGAARGCLAAELRAARHKLTAYQDSCHKARNKYSVLEVPGELEPALLRESAARAAAAVAARARWARAADDAHCTRALREQTKLTLRL